MEDPPLERFPPVMLASILAALRRFEPDLYAHLSRTHHVDADRIIGLFSELELIGQGQLQAILADLRLHQAYHDIVYLAGRNACLESMNSKGLRQSRIARDAARFQTLMKQLLPPFLGLATYSVLMRADLFFVELRGSVFARDIMHNNGVCGFYSGMLAELGTCCTEGAATAMEVRCVAADPEAASCMFRVSL